MRRSAGRGKASACSGHHDGLSLREAQARLRGVWPWSSYPGYDRRRRRVEWVAYDALYSAWLGESGGNDPEAAYRRFVEQGLATAPANPFQSAAHGWLLGSEKFIERMRSLLSEPRNRDEVPAVRRLASLDAATVVAAVARYYGVA